VLGADAVIEQHRSGHDLAGVVPHGDAVDPARRALVDLVAGVLRSGHANGTIRSDVPAVEPALFAVHALSAAAGIRTDTGVRGLVSVVIGAVSV